MGKCIFAEQMRDFYKEYSPDLSSITDLNRRHFRFLLPNGRFFKIKDVIHSPDDLQRWLVKLRPLDVYYSTSMYLNPTSVAPRPKNAMGYWGPGNIILGNDIAFDLDRQPLSILNLERARKDAVRLLATMVNNGHELKYIAFSGSKGFHLLFSDVEKEIEQDFRSRESVIMQRRKVLVDEIAGRGIRIDASVTVDTRRIIRLPGTVNSKTGYCCQLLSTEQLRSPVTEWIDSIVSLDGHRKIPRFTWKPLAKRQKATLNAQDTNAPYGFTTFITSSVLGTRGRHAVLLSLTKSSLESVTRILRRAQREYDLTDIYLFELPRSYQAICLKTVQRNRYQKILDLVHSPSASQLRNYERVSLRMGPLVGQYMQELEPPARFITYLECSPEVRANNYVSQGHMAFLRKHGLTPLEYPHVHGNEEFKLVDAEIRL
jgi:DNA primase catalytic subunit